MPNFLGLTTEQFQSWLEGTPLVKNQTVSFQNQIDFVLEGLIDNEQVTKRLINLKRGSNDIQLIPKSESEVFLSKGYEIIDESTLKVKVSKPKPYDQLFEDRVWALMADMGFDYYNQSRSFRIKFSDPKVTGKQIDVFVGDKESVLLIECKSSINKSSSSFQKDIDQIAHNRARINSVIKKFFKANTKIGYIFWTENVIVNNNDKIRLKDNGIKHFNQDDLEYFQKLTSLLGPAAKYQFIGKVFENMEIPELPNRVPAVQGKMGGYTYYSFSIEPETLLKIGCVLHRRDSSTEAFETYQRMVQKSRITSIQKYIDDDGGYFPNSIIININSGRHTMDFDLADNSPKDSLSRIGILHLPKKYQSAIIIDGQHRLYGYAKSYWRSRNSIPVVAFENLPGKEQTKLFVDINHEQKSVKKNLLLSIMSDFNWGSSNDDEVIEALPVRLVRLLNDSESSPLYKRIQLAEEPISDQRCLTLEYLIRYGLKSKTNFFGVIRKKRISKIGHLTGKSHKDTLVRSLEFFSQCLQYFELKLPTQWAIGKGEGGFIAMNIGITSLFRILNDLLEYLTSCKEIETQRLTPAQLFDEIQPFLEEITNFLSNCAPDLIKDFRSNLGAAGTEHVVREYQKILNEFDDSFNPDGLQDWIKTNSGQFNLPAKEIGDRLQLKIRNYIFKKLQESYGISNKNWWIEGVPINVQKSCTLRHIEEKRTEPEENYLDTIDYWEIVSKNENKHLFTKLFTPAGQEQVKNADKKWFVEFNNIRKKYSHPERKRISEEELKFLSSTEEWLIERLE
ncbi:MAG: DGQHR domain-containing protein [Cyclobacteriaceae bacterium]